MLRAGVSSWRGTQGGSPWIQLRFASKKAQGSSNNGRDSNPKYRGLKKNHLQRVKAGNILIRQVGNRFHAGEHVGCGRDYTLYAKAPGVVRIESNRRGRSYIHIIPDPNYNEKYRFYPNIGDSPQATILRQCLGIDLDNTQLKAN